MSGGSESCGGTDGSGSSFRPQTATTVHHGRRWMARGRLPEGVPDLIAIMGNVGRSAFSVRRALADAVGAVPRFRALRDEAWVVASDSSSWLSIPLHA